jgi:hypothetical protein
LRFAWRAEAVEYSPLTHSKCRYDIKKMLSLAEHVRDAIELAGLLLDDEARQF